LAISRRFCLAVAVALAERRWHSTCSATLHESSAAQPCGQGPRCGAPLRRTTAVAWGVRTVLNPTLARHMGREPKLGSEDEPALDLARPFMPEALAGLAAGRTLDEDDRLRLNQIRAASYVHLFDVFETSLA